MKAKVIPASNRKNVQKTEARQSERLKVAAYCRVSSLHEEQESSYEIQCEHYTKLINDRPDWDFAGIYADEGISGVSTRNRDEFNRMIRDCEAGKISLILTKSISRFARNTLDALTYIRKLRAMNVGIYFEKENIATLEAQGELLITILSSIAQQESESISRNVQMGIRFHYQEGRICAGHQNMLGYRRSKDGHLEIVPDEAEIVRWIYRMFLNGCNAGLIGAILRQDRIRDRSGRERTWKENTILYILQNEKYMGDLLLQKYYTRDFLTKKVELNDGQVPQYYVSNSHPPIIPREVYNRVQNEIARRRSFPMPYRNMRSNALAGKIVCEECGSHYVRKSDRGGTQIYFRCGTHINRNYREKAALANSSDPSSFRCHSRSIREDHLRAALVQAFSLLPEERDGLLKLRERINWGPIAQADRIGADLEKQIKDNLTEEGIVIDQELQQSLESQLTDIRIKRAEYASLEMHVRNLLDWVEDIWAADPRVQAFISRRPPVDPPAWGPSCSDPEEFYARTRIHFPQDSLLTYSEEKVFLYIDKIVLGDKIRIHFKGNVTIELDRPEDAQETAG